MPITYYYSHRFNDRLVPQAEVNLGVLNVGYGESGPSDFIAQEPLSALSGPSEFITYDIAYYPKETLVNQSIIVCDGL